MQPLSRSHKNGCARGLALVLAVCIGFATHAHPGRGIVVDADGQVYVSDAVRSVVWRLAPDGRIEAAARDVHAHWLALAAEDAVLADHVHYDAQTQQFLRGLVRIDAQGSVQVEIAPRPDPDGLDAGAFAVRGSDLLIARDSLAVIEVRRHGRMIRTITLPANERPVSSLGVDSHGGIVAVRGREVLRVDTDGGVRIIGSAPQLSRDRILGLRDLWGLALGADGTIYTTDPGLRQVIAFDAKGTMQVVHEVPSPWFPTGLAAHGSCLLVLEHGLADGNNLGPRVSCVEAGRPSRVLGIVADP